MNILSARGFIQFPILLAVVILGAAGTYTAAKLPQYFEEVKQKQLQKELAQNNLPAGTASSEEILVGFRGGVASTQRDLIHQQARAGLKRRIGQINTDVVRIPAGSSVREMIAHYQNLPQIEYAEPNFLAVAFLTPNDPLYHNQWNLQKVVVEDAYDVVTGGFGPIAIVDTGVDAAHADLIGLVLEGYNTIDETSNTLDDHGHGTHVAGIASAQTNNTTGVASISHQATILPIKVLNKDGVGTYGDVSEGIIYAADKNVRIINLSLGGSSDSTTLKRAVNYALNRGSLLVAAAGNNGNDAPMYPAVYEGVLAVSASDKNDNLAGFSSFGSNIFVASPGVAITSSVPGGSYKEYSGTSMSAPHLSGLLALSLSAKPSLSNAQLIGQIKNNTEKVGSYSYDQNGWNPYFGYGRITAGKTLKSISSDTEVLPSPTSEPVSDTSRLPTQARVPKEYRFTFELQGTIDNIDAAQNKLVIKVDGGTPDVMKMISGNLVDLYVDSQTGIKYQGRNMLLSELSSGARVNVKGNVVKNKLLAIEILVQYIPIVTPTRPAEQDVPQLPQQRVPQNQEQSSPGQESLQRQLPVQVEERGKVRGASKMPFWQALQERILYLFGE